MACTSAHFSLWICLDDGLAGKENFLQIALDRESQQLDNVGNVGQSTGADGSIAILGAHKQRREEQLAIFGQGLKGEEEEEGAKNK